MCFGEAFKALLSMLHNTLIKIFLKNMSQVHTSCLGAYMATPELKREMNNSDHPLSASLTSVPLSFQEEEDGLAKFSTLPLVISNSPWLAAGMGNLKQPLATEAFLAHHKQLSTSREAVSAGHLHSFSSAFTVAKREGQSQERDAACSPVQPEFWMRSLTFAMPVALWPHSTLQGFWEEEAMQRSSEACCFLAALTDVWQCALLWQQPAAMLSLAKTIGSRWLCPILP